MKIAVFVLTFIFSGWAYAESDCDMKQMQFSNLDISVKDTEYLKRIMSFSYENEAEKFIPDLKSSFSGMYYKGNKNEPLVTYLFSSFKSEKMALKAADYLKARWLTNNNNQYDVYARGKNVIWFGNNSLSAACFKRVVEREKSKAFKL